MYFLFYMKTLPFYLYVLLLRTQNETLQLCVKEFKPSKSFIENSFLFLGCFLICWLDGGGCFCKVVSKDSWFWNAIYLLVFGFFCVQTQKKWEGKGGELATNVTPWKNYKLSMNRFLKCTLKCFLGCYLREHFMVLVMNLCLKFQYYIVVHLS